MRRILSAALAALCTLGPITSAPAAAESAPLKECGGVNLFDALPPDEQAALSARAESAPFATGNFWRAERDGQEMTIIGTYHLADSRHDAVVTAAEPLIRDAAALLVEAGPDEEKALKTAMTEDPSLIFITEGPSLLERLPAETWERLSAAMETRGIPPFMAAKFQPWYAMSVLSLSPCEMPSAGTPRGLDSALIGTATEAGIPIRALEPYDTVFSIFGAMTPDQETDMIESTLLMEGRSGDFTVTLADLYFRGESRVIWELTREVSYDLPGATPEQVDAEMAMMEDAMMNRRNRAWIPVIDAAAAEGTGPLVVAFGALHLSGEEGVLNLLAQEGWTLTPLEF